MKITHLATGAVVLLLLIAGYLMLDSANDKKFAQMQDKINQLVDLQQKSKLATTPAPAPDVAEVPSASTDTVAKPIPAVTKSAPKASTEAIEPEVALPNPTEDLKLAPGEKALLMEASNKLKAELQPAAKTYNPLQLKIKSLPAVAKVKSFNPDYSFVELDAGKNKSLEKGMSFDLRRDAMIVGKVIIGETVEDALSIADVDPKSVPAGVVIQPGDEIILLN